MHGLKMIQLVLLYLIVSYWKIFKGLDVPNSKHYLVRLVMGDTLFWNVTGSMFVFFSRIWRRGLIMTVCGIWSLLQPSVDPKRSTSLNSELMREKPDKLVKCEDSLLKLNDVASNLMLNVLPYTFLRHQVVMRPYARVLTVNTWWYNWYMPY